MLMRRKIILGVGAGALATPLAAFAQQGRKIPVVGVLHPGSPPPAPLPPSMIGLQQGLREAGYIEGQTILVEYRYAGGRPETMPGLALELVKLKVDVLYAASAGSINALKAVAGTIPVVAADLEVDPIASGFAASFRRPGGNITGMFLDAPGIAGKWLQMLTEVVPGMKSAAVLSSAVSSQWQLESLKAAARTLSIALDVVELRNPAELEALLGTALKKRPQALIQLSSPIVSQFQARIAKFTQDHRLPAISMYTAFPERGGLMSYGPDLPVFFRRVAVYVDRILKGAKPADIPIEQPTTFEMVVNMKTAKALGLKIPETILLQATRLIE
jgi:putative tryptophan/tyrosine transport system substrate-binding protein